MTKFSTSIMDIESRQYKVQEYLKINKIDALIVTNPINLFYLSNYENKDALIVVTQEQIFYLVDARYYEAISKFLKHLKPVLLRSGKSFLLKFFRKYNIKTLAYEANNITISKLDSLKENLMGIELIKTKSLIENFRNIKDGYELSLIRKASSISKLAFEKIENEFDKFKTEQEIADFYEDFIKIKKSEGTSFDIIIANGKGSSIPHYGTTNNLINKDKITLLDLGCKYKGYCSDMTRMVIPKTVSPKIKKIYKIVEDAKSLAIKSIKEGIKAKTLSKLVIDYFKKFDLDKYFLHSLGHSVGLEVHDSLVINNNSDFYLKEGMIITIEPGLYFEGEFGIRLEDMVLVKKDGFEIL